jgi:hypothetical protein
VAKKKPLPHLLPLLHLLLKLLLPLLPLPLLLLHLLLTHLLLHLLPLLPARRSNFFCFPKMPPSGGFFFA